MSSKLCNVAKSLFLTAIMVLASASVSLAGGGAALPWDAPITALTNNLQGPFLQSAIIVAIVATGIGIGFAEAGSWLKRGLSVVCGLSVAALATSWGLGFLGFAAAGAGF